jgi:hypothetical protein
MRPAPELRTVKSSSLADAQGFDAHQENQCPEPWPEAAPAQPRLAAKNVAVALTRSPAPWQ